MTIDLRLFIPIIAPFAAWAFLRLFWWFAGAEWSDPEAGAFFAVVLGFPFGLVVMDRLFERGTEIGKIRFGRKQEE